MSKLIHIAANYTINATDYATQGNAILGIRDSGKTYTGTKAAEGLLDAGIPIIVFDPIGIWKNLKIGVGKHKGYPIVVAGGEGADIRLTPQNAVEIVRAAMKENVSLVIDLYSPELINKSTWIRIVQEAVDELMYQNKNYGVRHVIIEEAAEFIPQRLQPQHARVYASLERLARMGRNAHLGMTIINQRAEEVNKAILEIMALCLLHKQVGKNSLLSIKKWLELRSFDKKGVDDIINQLPQLKQGECYVISDEVPVKIKILEKNTYHPDPKKPHDIIGASLATIDVGDFVAKMKKQLEKKEAPGKPIAAKQTNSLHGLQSKKDVNQLSKIEDQNRSLQIRNGELLSENTVWKRLAVTRGLALSKIKSIIFDLDEAETKLPKIDTLSAKSETNQHQNGTNVSRPVTKHTVPKSVEGVAIGKAEKEILIFLTQFQEREFTKVQIAVAVGYAVNGGGFNNAISKLVTLGLIIRGHKLCINKQAKKEITNIIGEVSQKEYGYEHFRDNLAKAEREIYEVLVEHPTEEMTKQEIADRTPSQYEPNGGGFNNALSRLSTLELIKKERGIVKLNPELLELT